MGPTEGGIDAAARRRAAAAVWARDQAALRRVAQRFSICPDDADEALARGLEIVLRKAPSEDSRELIRWTQTVVRHEALAVRKERERILAGPAARTPEPGEEDWTAAIPSAADGPLERAERQEVVARSREALAMLKPAELRALTLLAEGYSYREIATMTGFSATKVNRSLAEGRERFRHALDRAASGRRCADLAPLVSAFADGEAGADAERVREHLRACPHCRATLRAYRAVPRAAAALAPAVPFHRSLAGRLHDAVTAAAGRVGVGGGDSALAGAAATGGTRGLGAAAVAKLLAVCAGTVGGAAACVAGGVIPPPLELTASAPPAHESAAPVHRARRHLLDAADESGESAAPEYESEPVAETTSEAEPATEGSPPHETGAKGGEPADGSQPASTHSSSAEPESEAGAVEFAAPEEVATPEPVPAVEPAPAPSTSAPPAAASAAGEFGP